MRKCAKGDTVVVIAGRERGKRGKVLRVVPDKGRVVVEHINMVKRHQRPTQKLRQGGIIEREAPLHVSNVMLVDPRDATSRPGSACRCWRTARKARVCRRCGEIDRQGVRSHGGGRRSPKARPRRRRPGQGGREASRARPGKGGKGGPRRAAAPTAKAEGTGDVPPRLRERYRATVMPALMKERGYTNPFQVPRLEKIVINMGVGEGKENAKVLDFAAADMLADHRARSR